MTHQLFKLKTRSDFQSTVRPEPPRNVTIFHIFTVKWSSLKLHLYLTFTYYSMSLKDGIFITSRTEADQMRNVMAQTWSRRGLSEAPCCPQRWTTARIKCILGSAFKRWNKLMIWFQRVWEAQFLKTRLMSIHMEQNEAQSSESSLSGRLK